MKSTHKRKRNKPISKLGLDAGPLIALAENDQEFDLDKGRSFIEEGNCYVYQLAINEAIGVFMSKGYEKEEAKDIVLGFIEKHNIEIIKDKDINIKERNDIYEYLKKQRKNIKHNPGKSDLRILASYKVKDIDCILTTNFKHFIELGKKLGIWIEGMYTKDIKRQKKVDNMWRDLYE